MQAALAVLVVTTIFSAGGFFYMVKRMRRDMNGIGKRLADTIANEARRHHNLGLAVMAGAPEDKRTEIASLIREDV